MKIGPQTGISNINLEQLILSYPHIIIREEHSVEQIILREAAT